MASSAKGSHNSFLQKQGVFLFALVCLAALSALLLIFLPQASAPSPSPKLTTSRCAPVPKQEFQMSSHGYRVWFGDTLESFEHTGQRICVPEGWRAVGAVEEGPGWAIFGDELSGVIIKSSAFASRVLRPRASSYEITVVYPVTTDPDFLGRYLAIITNAFDRIGALFGDSREKESRPHTVLITAGVAGDTYSLDTRVYPDPGPDATMFVRSPDQFRAQELLIHAVMHLYNRQREDLLGYQKLQAPFTPEDWQELEASWAETAFTTSREARLSRLEYLYRVHTAVQTNDFSLVGDPPFDTRGDFEKICRDVIVKPGSTYMDYQYCHYILVPLSMVATQGLFLELGIQASVEQLLTDVHTGKIEGYFTELGKLLSTGEVDLIRGWMHRGETVPWGLVLKAAEYYAASFSGPAT